MIKPDPAPCCRNERGCCPRPSGERRWKKRSKKSSPNQSKGLSKEDGLRVSTVFSTVIYTTAGTACRATLRKAFESSRAVEVPEGCAWGTAGRNRVQASSQALRSSRRHCLALAWLCTV